MAVDHEYQLEDRGPGCPLCGSAEKPIHQRQVDVFEIVRCDHCGFMFVPRLLKRDHKEASTDLYGGARQRQGQEINAEFSLAAVSQLLADQRTSKVLDIGAGYGFFLNRLHQRYPSCVVQAVETSRVERAYSIDTFGIQTWPSLDEVSESGFDLVTLFEVIEHVEDPLTILRQAYDLLRPGGRIVVGTDNFESGIVSVLDRDFPKWIPHQHISLFSPMTLSRALREVGFEVTDSRSFTAWELCARAMTLWLTGGRIGTRRYSLNEELSSENVRPYRFFWFRKLMSPILASLLTRPDGEGEMMYLTGRKA
jgi:2-polyprenyl-3-methyl-5-hydroxy-6-metoxy-1,4-benzoquinol methylase